MDLRRGFERKNELRIIFCSNSAPKKGPEGHQMASKSEPNAHGKPDLIEKTILRPEPTAEISCPHPSGPADGHPVYI